METDSYYARVQARNTCRTGTGSKEVAFTVGSSAVAVAPRLQAPRADPSLRGREAAAILCAKRRCRRWPTASITSSVSLKRFVTTVPIRVRLDRECVRRMTVSTVGGTDVVGMAESLTKRHQSFVSDT